MSKRARLRISFDLLKAMGSRPGEAVRVVSNDIPEDAQIVAGGYSWEEDSIVIVLESEKFGETEMGKNLPLLTGPLFERVKL